MKTDRPVNLNLLAFSFPLAAIVSITHRITGVILFVGVAFALYALDMAEALRYATVPVIGRLKDERVLLDMHGADPIDELINVLTGLAL